MTDGNWDTTVILGGVAERLLILEAAIRVFAPAKSPNGQDEAVNRLAGLGQYGWSTDNETESRLFRHQRWRKPLHAAAFANFSASSNAFILSA